MLANSLFKTSEGAAEYLSAYNSTLSLWPVPHEALDVKTSFGTTHINAAGSTNLPPLILLHGFGVCSTQWYPNVASLIPHFRIYAPDVMHQMGLSIASRRIKTRQDCADWLSEMLNALKLERASFVGHSYGGWLALNLALLAPLRVDRLVLLSPAASFGSIRLPFLLHFLSGVFFPSRSRLHGFMQSMTTVPLRDHHPMIEQLMMGIKHFKGEQIGSPVTKVFKDEELHQLHTPTLLLVGDHDVSCKPDQVINRAKRLIPHIQAELVKGGHLFPTDQADTTNHKILDFLNLNLV